MKKFMLIISFTTVCILGAAESGLSGWFRNLFNLGSGSVYRGSAYVSGFFNDSNSIDFNKDGYEVTNQSPQTQEQASDSEAERKHHILQEIATQPTPVHKLIALGQALNTPHKYVMYDRESGAPDWIAFTGQNANPTECETYKIHLMPKEYSLDFIYDVTQALLNNPVLKQSVHTSKFNLRHVGELITDKESIMDYSGDIAPFVVLYIFTKENAQKSLNEIYHLFGRVEGSGIRPRFNGKLTDLIWFAQGNANSKFDINNPGYIAPREPVTFEQPDKIYCASETVPNPNYLYHPETGEPLRSTGQLSEAAAGPSSSTLQIIE